MSNKILFVWDFHGVLEKDNIYAVRDICNLVLDEFGFAKKITIQETIKYYGLSWLDYFKFTLPEGNYELWNQMVKRVLTLQEKGWNIIKSHIKPRDFSKDVLQKIKENNNYNILLTNSSVEHAKRFIDFIDLAKYIDEVKGVDYHWSCRPNQEIHNLKSQLLLDFLKIKNYKKIIAIGDRESDIKAGKNCGAITYLFVDLKINKRPEETEADYVISDLREILKELN